MKEQYLTVTQFAKQAGVTPQYVYKQLNSGKLKPYAETINNKKMIRADALDLYRKPKKNENTEQQLIAILREQLVAKDKQIQELQDIVRAEQTLRYSAESRLQLLEGSVDDQTVKPIDTPTEANTEVSASRTTAPVQTTAPDTVPKSSFWVKFLSLFRDGNL